MWPTIAATEELGLRLLTECAAIARLDPARRADAAQALFDGHGLSALRQALAQVRLALADRHEPQPVAGLPAFLRREVDDLYRSLRSDDA